MDPGGGRAITVHGTTDRAGSITRTGIFATSRKTLRGAVIVDESNTAPLIAAWPELGLGRDGRPPSP